MPCAIQNEMDVSDVELLAKNGCKLIAEVSNMGLTNEAAILATNMLSFAPGKAVNAGGVAVSGLEMSQNSMRYAWQEDEVDTKLHLIMKEIHKTCIKYGRKPDGSVNYVVGANIGGFVKVAAAMLAQGVV